jgi:hypothetical protein
MGRDWGELRKGRSVHEQPGARVDENCTTLKEGFQVSVRGIKRKPARGGKDGFEPYLYRQSVYVYIIIV